MRLASFFLPPRARRAESPAPLRLTSPFTTPGPAPAATDALDWVTRRAAAHAAEWRRVVAAIELAWQRSGEDERRAARAYADMERRGEVVRRHASPAMRADGLALWWLRVGRRAPIARIRSH